MFAQDYKLVICWTPDKKPYWVLYRKGAPVSPSEEEMELIKSIMKF